jgi:hypothetical protein
MKNLIIQKSIAVSPIIPAKTICMEIYYYKAVKKYLKKGGFLITI